MLLEEVKDLPGVRQIRLQMGAARYRGVLGRYASRLRRLGQPLRRRDRIGCVLVAVDHQQGHLPLDTREWISVVHDWSGTHHNRREDIRILGRKIQRTGAGWVLAMDGGARRIRVVLSL